jgi:hypothetical protein
VTHPQEVRALLNSPDLEQAVTVVLPGEAAPRCPAYIGRRDRRFEKNPTPGIEDPLIQFLVLILNHLRIKQSHTLEYPPRPASKPHGVRVSRSIEQVKAVPATNAKWAGCRSGGSAAGFGRAGLSHLTADIPGAACRKRADARGQVPRIGHRMTVHTDDHVTSACPDRRVQRERRHKAGIVHDAHSRITRSDRLDDLASPIGRPTVRNDDFHVRIDRVREQWFDRPLDR